MKRVHAGSDDPQGVDVQPRVRLVEDRQDGLEHRHLEDLVALLFAARETLVDGPPDELLVDLDELRLLLRQR